MPLPDPLSRFRQLADPLVVGHRGFPSRYPENTLPSFRAAVAAGVGMLEMDLQLSADGEVVVLHDATLERTTGVRARAGELTLAQLTALDAGSWFSPRFAGTTLPSLAQVLAEFGGQVLLNLELKPGPEPGAARDLARRVWRDVASQGLGHAVVVSSFREEACRAWREAGPGHLAVLAPAQGGARGLSLARELGALCLNAPWQAVSVELVAAARRTGLGLLAFASRRQNGPTLFRRLLAQGVTGFFADNPALCLREAARWRSSSGGEGHDLL
ncbi:MAG: glycerophosphodiester phosphodiesterase [Deltaproteobacteria bacterium]|nr:glycerophosphodiester phosphodiesterase [Deltaproteobacteria bacterium]